MQRTEVIEEKNEDNDRKSIYWRKRNGGVVECESKRPGGAGWARKRSRRLVDCRYVGTIDNTAGD